MSPLIAITVSRTRGQDLAIAEARRAANARYVKALQLAGVDEPLVLEPDSVEPERFDAVLLAGGGDIHPGRYDERFDLEGDPGEPYERIDPDRDALELAMARRALAEDKPILGICRGFQLLNVAMGGRLVPDMGGHRDESGPVVEHVVTPAAPSRLAAMVGAAPFLVNSRHHQAITARELADGLVPTAHVGGLIEAFESPPHRWVVGVQWHPERAAVDRIDEPAAKELFSAFVRAASRIAEPAS